MNQALFSRTNIALWVAMAVGTAAGYALVPAGTALPIHWGPTGQPDAFWPRDTALLIAPVLTLAVSLIFLMLGKFAPPAQLEASRYAWRTVVPALTGMFLLLQGGIVLIGLGYPDQMVRLICFGLGIMLILLGNIMPKMQPNGLAGIRLPWLADAAVWRSTQRLGGITFMAGGAVLLVSTLLVADPILLFGILAASLAVPLVVTTLYSYGLVRRS